MSQHYYSDLAVQTSLTGAISNSATVIAVGSTTGFPVSFPYYLALDFTNTGLLEIVEVSSASSLNLTVVRGQSGTAAVAHSIGAAVVHVAPAQFYNDTSLHTNENSNVHGVTGNVVGTTDTQTLTNKTISGASNTITNIPVASFTGTLPIANGGTNAVTAAAARTSLGVAIGSNVEAWSAALDNLAALVAAGSFGLIAITGANTVAHRQLVATAGGQGSSITILNPDGAAGNPGIGLTFQSPVPVVYTASGTYTAIQNGVASYIRIRCVNGGGGAGGAAATVSNASCSGAGAGGAYSEKVIATSGLTFPLQVSVGGGGGGGGPGNFGGGAGGESAVKDNNGAGATLCTPGAQNANQAGGGGAATVSNGAVGTPGFNVSTTGGVGDIVIPGQPAATGILYAGGGAVAAAPGGSSVLGAGGFQALNGTGGTGNSYGGGGGGCASLTGAQTGGSGGNGVVIIEPLY